MPMFRQPPIGTGRRWFHLAELRMNAGRCFGLLTLLLLTACGPSEQQRAQWAEEQRIQCLDQICEGDSLPNPPDRSKEFVLKLNGVWYFGPTEYGGYGGAFAFYWPSRTPINRHDALKFAPELRPSSPGVNSNFHDVAIEIFLRSNTSKLKSPSRYQALLNDQAQGWVISKTRPRPGLEVWRTLRPTDGRLAVTRYVATDLRDANDEPPVLSCMGIDGSERDITEGTCTMAFRWKPKISADLRFNARHGPDWPEIYLEVTRVLQLLKEV